MLASQESAEFLERLNNESPEETLCYIYKILNGQILLHKLIHDETPSECILRHKNLLNKSGKENVKLACNILLKKFLEDVGDTEYGKDIIKLIVGFGLTNSKDYLVSFIKSYDFLRINESLQKTILFALIDLNISVENELWYNILNKFPHFGGIVLSGMLLNGTKSGLQILPLLSDNESIADSVFVILQQHLNRLSESEKSDMIEISNTISKTCSRRIKEVSTCFYN